MFKLRYYCQGEGKKEIQKLLINIKEKHNIQYEILDLSRNGVHDKEKEKVVYETEFKPRAKVLKKRTGQSIKYLRSHKARNYFISLPGTIAIIKDTEIKWYTLGDKKILEFLQAILKKGHICPEEYCR